MNLAEDGYTITPTLTEASERAPHDRELDLRFGSAVAVTVGRRIAKREETNPCRSYEVVFSKMINKRTSLTQYTFWIGYERRAIFDGV